MGRLRRREFVTGSAGSAAVAGCATGSVMVEERSVAGPQQAKMGPDPWIDLDREALRANLSAVRSRVGSRPVMPVIKANGYGHGLVTVARALEREGVAQVAVAKVSEGLALRREGISTAVLNLGPLGAREIPDIISGKISQTVWTREVDDLAKEARRRGKMATVQVNVDTGLGRVGVPHGQAFTFIEHVVGLQGVRLEGVFTGLTEDAEFDKTQLARLAEVTDKLKDKGISVGFRHAASSAAVMDNADAFLDMVRPGIAIYGLYPNKQSLEGKPIQLRPVLSLKTRVVMVKALSQGESLSYHRAYVAERSMRVATLPIGYSDGYPASAAGKTEVLIRGKRFPVIAMVTANHTLVDVTADERVSVGDEAVIIGRQGTDELTAHAVADAAGVSAYKLVIGLGASLPRRFHGA